MEYDVFISYSRKDYVDENKQVIPGNVVSQIKALFDANGISYWFDEDGVYSGDAFAPMIARNIKAAKIFLFISSENSNASEWTSNEIATAHTYRKKIIPFRFDNSVYNDSVIIYIARLDYIEYKSNPNKSLSRLLLSVQSYLKEEQEKKEQEKKEQERRRLADISRQESAAKLQSLRERIEKLENRKYEIEKDILAQEKSLSDLRNEKRILEANISELQEEVALLGHTRPKKEANNELVTQKNQLTNRSFYNFFAQEWSDLRSALSLKHWSVNLLHIGMAAFSLIEILFTFPYFELWNPIPLPAMVTLSALLTTMLGLYRVMKNQRDGIIWTLLSYVAIAGSEYYDDSVFIFIEVWPSCLFAIILLLSSMLISKNRQSAWSVMQKRSIKFREDYLFWAYIASILMMIGCFIVYFIVYI